jgi:hypothetical protein
MVTVFIDIEEWRGRLAAAGFGVTGWPVKMQQRVPYYRRQLVFCVPGFVINSGSLNRSNDFYPPLLLNSQPLNSKTAFYCSYY